MKDTKMQSNFSEILNIITQLPKGDVHAYNAAAQRNDILTKPQGSLGRLEDIALWVATWQGLKKNQMPKADYIKTLIFAGNHGIAQQNVSAFPQHVTAQMLQNFQQGGAAINQLCGLCDSELQIFDLNIEQPTQDFSIKPAMTEEECVTAIAYGMQALGNKCDLVCLGEMGIANSTSAAAIAYALFGGKASDWVGRGTGINDQQLTHKIDIIEKSVMLHQSALKTPLHILQYLGGYELAAIIGAIIAARQAQVPVLCDGYACSVAAAILYAIDHNLLDHCQIGHLSEERGHTILCEKINKDPILKLSMRLGEGSGAATAALIVKAAIACHQGMATFADAGIAEKNE